jgi:predicted DNA-binding transcriptional regulator AlpA
LKALENQMRPKSKKEVKMEKQPTLENLINSLPPIISRDHVEKYLGGVISKRTLANLDSAGKGPKRMRIGRKIAYRTEDLLEWLSLRAKNLA